MNALVPLNPPPRGRILVVDDMMSMRILIAELLHKEGYEVEVAGDAREALQLAQLVRWDAVVLDINLPAMNGLELYAQMQRHTGRECLPVLFVTWRLERAPLPTLSQTPWTRLLAKPFDCREFLRCFDLCLQGNGEEARENGGERGGPIRS